MIADGKLAVVLGIEVDNLFNCHWATAATPTGDCSTDGIRQKVKQYYDLGVRHVFPIHNFDNAFGGPATWQDAIDVGNRASEGHWWSPRLADRRHADHHRLLLAGLRLQAQLRDAGRDRPARLPAERHSPERRGPLLRDVDATCNTIGLTPRGGDLVQALMDNGMIIDIDHMSDRAIDDTLATGAARANYPVVASHVQFFDL